MKPLEKAINCANTYIYHSNEVNATELGLLYISGAPLQLENHIQQGWYGKMVMHLTNYLNSYLSEIYGDCMNPME